MNNESISSFFCYFHIFISKKKAVKILQTNEYKKSALNDTNVLRIASATLVGGSRWQHKSESEPNYRFLTNIVEFLTYKAEFKLLEVRTKYLKYLKV